MANIVDENGISIKSLDEITEEITEDYKDIYGDDINVDSDAPDGQQINIYAKSVVDTEDLIVQVYNSFDPDQAIGVTLDSRVAINGIQRQGGTFTITPVEVTVDRALTLEGLDGDIEDPLGTGFTISDEEGNKFILTATENIAGAGTYTLDFRSQISGAVETLPNTLIIPVTIVLGVISVNNPTIATTIGLDQESDADLKLRRRKSVSLSSQGYLDSLYALLLNITGVTYVKIYENNTGAVDVDGIPSHSIWVVVVGGSDEDIGFAIYVKRNAGAGMRGNEIVDIDQVDGTMFQVFFDRVTTQDLHIKFTAESIDGIDPVDDSYIEEQMVLLADLDVNESYNINDVVSLVREIDPNTLVTIPQVSTDGATWKDLVETDAKNYQFTLQASDITITVIPIP